MPGNNVPLDTAPGTLGLAVTVITIVFAAMAVWSLLPRFWQRRGKHD